MNTLAATDFIFVWNPSTDDHGIASYEVALDGVIIGQTNASTLWYHVEHLVLGTTSSLTVRALDIDGLYSPWSVPLVVTIADEDPAP